MTFHRIILGDDRSFRTLRPGWFLLPLLGRFFGLFILLTIILIFTLLLVFRFVVLADVDQRVVGVFVALLEHLD
jgi:uncharacterized membrane protein